MPIIVTGENLSLRKIRLNIMVKIGTVETISEPFAADVY